MFQKSTLRKLKTLKNECAISGKKHFHSFCRFFHFLCISKTMIYQNGANMRSYSCLNHKVDKRILSKNLTVEETFADNFRNLYFYYKIAAVNIFWKSQHNFTCVKL